MQTWSITLHGPSGVISSVDTGESQFVVGTETASDVFSVQGDGISPRHTWVWISEAGLQVEDLGGGTLVNGYQISERVQVEYPASVQVGELTMVIEVKAVKPVVVSPTPSSLDITIPQRAVTQSKASLDVTIPQRTPTRGNAQKPASASAPSSQSTAGNKAPLTGEYTLVREIARGGMGQIYFGEDPQLERQVAVKVSSISEDGEDPRFSKEAKVLAQLAHPNIVPIHNIGVDTQGRPFYSMKLIKGRTLQAVLNLIRDGDSAAIKDYPRATLLTIFRKVCDAMMFAHSKGILHRDLKPENIMVGEYGEVLVMDWGLAKVLGEQENASNGSSRVNDTGDYGMTMEGEVMGTPQYMSPEQAMGMVAELDQRSDIYSLGGILYAILTLRPPIDGTTLDEVLTKVKNGSISSMVTKRGGKGPLTVGAPTAMGAEVPEALQAVTLKAMATDRNKRYASVEAFAGDIERYQNGFATQAEDAGALKRLLLFIKRNKAVSSAAALLLLAVVSFVVKLAASEREARAQEQHALEQMEKTRRAAAAANMSLADAAEMASDSVALQNALTEVPEDLRTTDWTYFRDRIDTTTFTWAAPKNMWWSGLEDWPSEPEKMLALRSDGELFAVNVKRGDMQSLWKFLPEGSSSRGPVGVSNDGTLVALGFKKGNDSHIEIRRLADQSLVGRLSQTTGLRRILLNDSLCVVEGTEKVQVWEIASARLLWEAPGYKKSEFSADHKRVLLARVGGAAESRDALTGGTVSTGISGGALIHGNWPHNTAASKDWRRFLSPMFGAERIRVLDPWTGKIEFEVTPRYQNFANVLIPPGDFFAVLGRVSPQVGVLEIRNASSGRLSRSLAFKENLLNERSAYLRAKSDALALRTPSALRVWRLPASAPHFDLACDVFHLAVAARIENTSRVITNVQGNAIKVELREAAEKDHSKRSQWQVKGYLARGSLDGSRLITVDEGKCAAYRYDSNHQRFQELWAPKAIPYLSGSLPGDGWAIHPTEDRVWTRRVAFEFSSGRILSEVKNQEGLNTRRELSGGESPVWVGSNRVVEIAIADSQSGEVAEFSGELLQIAVWDADLGTLVAKVKAPNAQCLCASPDGLHIAEGGTDKRVRIRNARTLEVEQEFRAHEHPLKSIAWHPVLPLLATVANDGLIRIWDLHDLRKIEEFTTKQFVGTEILRLEIPPNGLELVETQSRKIRVYLPESFREAK